MPKAKLPGGEKIELPYTKEGIEAAENIEALTPDADLDYAPAGKFNAQDRMENYPYTEDVAEELPPVEGLEVEGEGVLGESPLAVEPLGEEEGTEGVWGDIGKTLFEDEDIGPPKTSS